MSAVTWSLRHEARRCHRNFTRRQFPLRSSITRSFTSSASRFKDVSPDKSTKPKVEEEVDILSLSPEEQWARFEGTVEAMRHGELRDFTHRIVGPHMTEEMRKLQRLPERRQPKQKEGLLNLGVKNFIEDPEFEEDEITSLAHGELEQHREYRHYARLMAWEMPLLTKMATPFVPPKQSEILRFRYTTYMGEEHPAEKKVVVEFCPDDIPGLTTLQRDKLKKLLGVRFNPGTQIAKMSSEMFQSQAQNKRYLGDLIDSLVREAKDPTDTFEDVPLETRHYKSKTKPKFPREWRITPERQAQLDAGRAEALRLDQERVESGLLIDGGALVREANEKAMAAVKAAKLEEPAMITAKGAKGKAVKKLLVRR